MRRALTVSLLVIFSWSLALQEVVAPRVRVIFASPELEAYAQRVANEAERALELLFPLFASEAQRISILIHEGSDSYNAYASALPRARTGLRPLFPVEADLGFRDENDLLTLLLHEFAHNLQFMFSEGAPHLRLGIIGEEVAAVPPGWFVEGIAVWAESEYSPGGRRDDALTKGLRQSAVLEDAWPSLTGASLAHYGAWPGGLAIYLYGAGFTTFLLERYGLEGMREALKVYNSGRFLLSFAGAWQEALGVDLEAEWLAWQRQEREEAEARAAHAHEGTRLTETGWYTRAPAVSPDGRRLAWVSWPDGIAVAPLDNLEERTIVLRDTLPRKLEWLDEHTLAYTRVVRRPGTELSELFLLEVETGAERQVTTGARARLPSVTPEGCMVFVRDAPPEASRLMRWCEGELEVLWLAQEGQHIVGLAAGKDAIAVSLWRPGGFTDLALLADGVLRPLTSDRAQHLDPSWQDETTILFRSDLDPTGAFDLYRFDLTSHKTVHSVTRLTRTVGGAFGPVAANGRLLYVALGASGYDLAELVTPLEERVQLEPETPPAEARALTLYPVRSYNPWPSLAPFGWMPTDVSLNTDLRWRAEATLVGQDDAALHNYALTAGYDSGLTGLLGGAYFYGRYSYGELSPFTRLQLEAPLTPTLQLGFWPHQPHLETASEIVFGLRSELHLAVPVDRWTARARFMTGLLRLEAAGWQPELRAEASVTNARRDPWGYVTRGLTGRAVGLLSPARAGPTLAGWLELAYTQPLSELGLPGRATFHLRAGYRPPHLFPLARESDWRLMASLGYAHSLPLSWRYSDGLYALERLSFEPRLNLSLDSRFLVGAEVTAALDGFINYAAPLSLGLTLGYSEGFWYRGFWRLPF